MPRLEFQIAAQETPVPVEVIRMTEDGFTVNVDSTEFSMSMDWETPYSGWIREVDSARVHRFALWTVEDTLQFWLNGKVYTYTLTSTQKRYQQARGKTHAPASGDIKAPMPGTVLKILVASGDTVSANTPLLIMESMKMEMTLTAPMDSWVANVACHEGQLVEMNTILMQLEGVKQDEPLVS